VLNIITEVGLTVGAYRATCLSLSKYSRAFGAAQYQISFLRNPSFARLALKRAGSPHPLSVNSPVRVVARGYNPTTHDTSVTGVPGLVRLCLSFVGFVLEAAYG